MTPETKNVSKERVAWALAYLLFFIPMLMDVKTESTMFHAKQSFALCIAAIVAGLIPFIGVILTWIIGLVALWSAYQAYMGNKFAIPLLSEKMDMVYARIGLTNFFSVK